MGQRAPAQQPMAEGQPPEGGDNSVNELVANVLGALGHLAQQFGQQSPDKAGQIVEVMEHLKMVLGMEGAEQPGPATVSAEGGARGVPV